MSHLKSVVMILNYEKASHHNIFVRCPLGESWVWQVWLFDPNIQKMVERRDVTGLIKVLQKNNVYYNRRDAAEALGKLGNPKAVDALIIAIKDSDSDVRKAVFKALGKLEDPKAIDPLVLAIKDSDSDIRKIVVESLSKFGNPKAVDSLILALKDSSIEVRIIAAKALNNLGDPKAVDPLILALKDSDKNVRIEAALTLGNLGNLKAVDALISLLKDSVSDVCKAAVESLGKLGDPKAVDELISFMTSPNHKVWDAAGEVLGKICGPKEVDALIRAFGHYTHSLLIPFAVAKVLVKIGDPKAVHEFVGALKNKEFHIRSIAAKALGQMHKNGILIPLERESLLNLVNCNASHYDHPTHDDKGQTNDCNNHTDHSIGNNWSNKVNPTEIPW